MLDFQYFSQDEEYQMLLYFAKIEKGKSQHRMNLRCYEYQSDFTSASENLKTFIFINIQLVYRFRFILQSQQYSMMRKNDENNDISVKLLKKFTDRHCILKVMQKPPTESVLLPQSYQPKLSSSESRRGFKTVQKNGYIKFVQTRRFPASSHQSGNILSKSILDMSQLRSKASSQFLLKGDVHREAMKNRLEDKVSIAKKKLEEIKQEFKRKIQQKQRIVNKTYTLKPPVLLYQ